MEFDLPKEQSSIIKVIGIGGGGNNAVNHMFRLGITGVDFIVCNTDQQALDASPVPNKIQLGQELTEGRGAGSNPTVGKHAAIESIEKIKEILSHNTQMVFITAGMGGGTGTGAGPIIAQAAKELGILTVGIVTTPFSFEGKRRQQQAIEGLEEIKQNVDTLLVVNNDKLREMFGNLKISEAFSKADDVLSVAARGIAEIITVTGYINVDFEDVKTVMKEGGTAIMGSASVGGENRAIKAITQALSSPLLNDNDITGAQYILLNITSGDEEISMDEIDEITEHIQKETGYTADIIWGNGTNPDLGDKISVTVIATGFGKGAKRKTAEELNKVVHGLGDEVKVNITQSIPQPAKENLKHVEPQLKQEPTPVQEVKPTPPVTNHPIAEETVRPIPITPEKQETIEPIRELEMEATFEEGIIEEEVSFNFDLSGEITKQITPPTIPSHDEVKPFTGEIEEVLKTEENQVLFNFDLNPEDTSEKPQKEDSSFAETINSVDKNATLDDALPKEEKPVIRHQLVNDKKEEKPQGFELKKTAGISSEKRQDTSKANTSNEEGELSSEEQIQRSQERILRLKAVSLKMRTQNGINDLEVEPAYKRRDVNLADIPHSSESSVSRYTLSEDEDGRAKLKDNNSFLHDNVD